MRLVLAAVTASLFALAPSASASTIDAVDVFTGTTSATQDFGTGGGAGNTFPGAVAPFGLLAWSPDTIPSTDNFAGGYTYADDRLRGFSLTHLSGAGCASFGDVPVLPTTDAIDRSPSVLGSSDVDPRLVPRLTHARERGGPGTYAVTLDPQDPAQAIDVALAATGPRGGAGSFSFPAGSRGSVVFNAGGSSMANGDVRFTFDPSRREVSGEVESGFFCYHRNRYRLFFAAEFDRAPQAFGTWQGPLLRPGTTNVSERAVTQPPFNYKPIPGGPAAIPGNPSGTAQAGAYLTFDTAARREVRMRIGVSYTSVEAARANLRADAPTTDPTAARAQARQRWREAMGALRVRGGRVADRRTFATMLYRALGSPTTQSDADGRYRGMDGALHAAPGGGAKLTNVSGWDVYRTQVPLLAMLAPQRARDLARSLLADGAQSGWLPRWPVAASQTNVMTGDPAPPMIAGAQAFAGGLRPGEGLDAMVKGGEQTGRSANADYVQRAGLAGYLRDGYVHHDGTERSGPGSTAAIGGTSDAVWGSAATTLEYASSDFAIARAAARAGQRPVCERFAARAGKAWRALLEPTSKRIVPRYADGRFAKVDAAGEEGFAEGSSEQYTWMVPFDVAGLVGAIGGPDAAADRLDRFFAELNAGPKSAKAFLGNEPTSHTPWLYAWTSRPWRAQEVVARARRELFSTAPTGYPGNDDLGQMSAWYVTAAIGVAPVIPGTDVLVLGSPLFARADLRVTPRRTLRILARGSGRYLRAVRVDGRRWTKGWIGWRQLRRARTLELVRSKTPTRFATSVAARPPSYGSPAAICG